MSKNNSKKYSILLVSKSNSSIRRFDISKRSFVAVAATLAFSLVLFATTIAGLCHYRNAYFSTEKLKSETIDFQKNKAHVFSKLVNLEMLVDRTMRLSAKLDSVFDNANTEPAKGPIDEDDWRATLERMKDDYETPDGRWRSFYTSNADLDFEIDRIMTKATSVTKDINAAFLTTKDKLFFWASVPSMWPTQGWITSGFGARRLSGRRTGGRQSRWHEGIDIAAPRGTPIMTSADGFVTFDGYKSGYGQTLIVDHGNGISTLYAHCSSLLVQEGDYVKRGMIIASVGNTGRSTGPHLHYVVQIDGVAVDPLAYIVEGK